jgi:hypothetical protein
VTTSNPPAVSQQAAVDAALLILERMGLSPYDPTAVPRQRPSVPTFADYVPVVSAAVTDGTRKAYGSYWNRVTEQWGARRLDEPTPSEIGQLVKYVRAHVVPRRNARRGHGDVAGGCDGTDRGRVLDSAEPDRARGLAAGPGCPPLPHLLSGIFAAFIAAIAPMRSRCDGTIGELCLRTS